MFLSTSRRHNSTIFSRVSFAVLLIVVLSAGCVSHGRRGEIPFGTWSGEGVFVYENWKQDGENTVDPKPISLSRRYQTSLTIRPRELDGHDVIVGTVNCSSWSWGLDKMIGNASIKSEHADLEQSWATFDGKRLELNLSCGPLITLERRSQVPAPLV